MIGDPVVEQVGGSSGGGPVLRSVIGAGQVNSACAVGNTVDENEVFVVGMAGSGLVLVNGKSESPGDPVVILGNCSCSEKHFVRDVEVFQRLMSASMMAVVADQHQHGVVELAAAIQVVDHGADQDVGLGEGLPGRTELPTATSVAHGVGLGQPDDGDRLLKIDKVPKRVRGIGIVEMLPGLVSSQERKVA